MFAETIKAITELLKVVQGFFRKTPERPTETSERIEEDTEEQGDLTMVAGKMLELMRKKRRKK